MIGAIALLMASLVNAQTTQPGSKFLRFVADQNGGGVLQTSIVTYRNEQGKTVDLIGAVHIADQRYFKDLSETFKGYDALLYELVKPKDVVPGQPRPQGQPQGERPLQWVGTMQQMLKEALELTFQLDEIDYARPNMVHADLDTETFMQMQADRGESILTLMLQQMIREMARPQPAAGAVVGGAGMEAMDVAGFLMALQSPDRSRQLKLMLARQFNQMDSMLGGLGGPGGTVIVTERNRAALTTLQKRLSAGDRNVGIFYGAAHLSEMEKDLTGPMGFKQVGEPKWITAWDMAAPAGARGAANGVRPATRPTSLPPQATPKAEGSLVPR